MDITNYIKPELLPVAIACYFAGMALKNTTIIKDKWIPFVLGTLSILFCVIYVAATADITGWQSALLGGIHRTDTRYPAGWGEHLYRPAAQTGKKGGEIDE